MVTAETDASNPSAVATEIREHGSAVLRKAWPAEKLGELRSAILAFSAARAKKIASGDPAASVDRMFHTHGVGTFAHLVRARLVRPELIRELFIGSEYHRICAAYFETDEFYVALDRLAFRVHDPSASDRSFIPYHQDSYTQDPRVLHVLNCWMTLDPGAGRDSPGLEVIRNPCTPQFPRKVFGLKSENAAYDFITIEREAIVAAYGDHFMAPVCEVGDGIIFSENVIHRTYVTPEMTRPRANFELRVFTPRSLAAGITMSDLGENAFRIV